MRLVADRDLAVGDEVSLAYVPAALPVGKRKDKLRTYGFECTCPACGLDSRDSSGSRDVYTAAENPGHTSSAAT